MGSVAGAYALVVVVGSGIQAPALTPDVLRLSALGES